MLEGFGMDGDIWFRRCPACRRIEIVETDEVVSEGTNHERCAVAQEEWVHFTAPPDWRPLPIIGTR